MKNIIKTLDYIRSDRKYFILLMFSAFLYAISPLINIIIPKIIIEQILGEKSIEIIIFLIILISFGNYLISFLINFVKYKISIFREETILQSNISIAKKYSKISYDKANSKELLDNIERSDMALYRFYMLDNYIDQSLGSILKMIMVSIVISSINYLLIPIIVIPNLLSIIFFKKLKEEEILYKKHTIPHNRAYSYFVNHSMDFRYSKDLRMNNSSSFVIRKAKENMDEIIRESEIYFNRTGKIEGFIGAIQEIQNAIIFTVLGIMLIMVKITVANFTMLYSACRELGRALNISIDAIRNIYTSSDEFESFINIMKLNEVEKREYPVKRIKEKELNLELIDIVFKYPGSDKKVLNKINMKFDFNSKTAIVGLNGSGKTTIVNLICRIYEPLSGEILLNGINIKDIDIEEYYKIISPVFQDYNILPATIVENISSKCKVNIKKDEIEKIIDVAKKINILEWINSQKSKEQNHLTKLIDNEGILPSGGQQQKIAIARSMYHGGSLLIVDEPTSALDPKSEEEVFDEILSLSKEKTTIFISHRLSSTRHADKIYVIDNGRVIEEGSHKDLILEPNLYAKMFNSQKEQYI